MLGSGTSGLTTQEKGGAKELTLAEAGEDEAQQGTQGRARGDLACPSRAEPSQLLANSGLTLGGFIFVGKGGCGAGIGKRPAEAFPQP